jgi:hypothetical protein
MRSHEAKNNLMITSFFRNSTSDHPDPFHCEFDGLFLRAVMDSR